MRVIDRVARTIISISGVAIICAVLGIGLFLILEILPLFQGARIHPGLVQPVLDGGQPAVLVVVDEHQEQAAVLGSEPAVRVVWLRGQFPPRVIPLEGLEGQQVRAVSRIPPGPAIALGTDQGDVWIGTLELSTSFDGAQRTTRVAVEPRVILHATPGYSISHLAYREVEGRSVVASVADEQHLIVTRITTQRPLIGPVRRIQDSLAVPLAEWGHPTAVLLNETGTQLLVGTSQGLIIRWRLRAEGPAELLETVQAVPDGSVSAMAYLLGSRSVAIGGSDGSIATWSLVREETNPLTETPMEPASPRGHTDGRTDGWRLTRIHRFPKQGAAIALINASLRDKGFITASRDGEARLHFMTSERTLAELALGEVPMAADFAPKANGAVFMDGTGRLHHWLIHNPHPEISWRALFGKLWYEGYPQPAYVWQSTGGTDDFESKFSLVPLIFGTLKGTGYALLFAIPLSIFGALYCSQFLEKRLRNSIKSSIELMAALPSVVLGFVAGIVLAPLVQGRIVSVLAMPLIVPLVSVGSSQLLLRLQGRSIQGWARRHEWWILISCTLLGVWVAWVAGPWIERGLFHGHFESWLLQTTGTRYDQRNALVVGWAIGFAVIPLIFTICEDAFSAVPRHLIGASLACGASLWQTAWHVVMPAAGSGVFSAIMVGFGRAVGETMIVLMATGNTPVLDWTIFNGFRALSANIAVEIPEAPYGGTLYRVLFVAALLLFGMTSLVNTMAELVRLRLRRQLQGL